MYTHKYTHLATKVNKITFHGNLIHIFEIALKWVKTALIASHKIPNATRGKTFLTG